MIAFETAAITDVARTDVSRSEEIKRGTSMSGVDGYALAGGTRPETSTRIIRSNAAKAIRPARQRVED
jgi:hypothetical protein